MSKLHDTQMFLAEAAPAATAFDGHNPVLDGRRSATIRTLAGRHAG